MAKNEHAAQNKGQQKTHQVRDQSGVESSMTQEEWKNRDKSAGLERVDDAEDAADTDTAADTPTATETPVVADVGNADAPAAETPVVADVGNADAPAAETPVVAPPA